MSDLARDGVHPLQPELRHRGAARRRQDHARPRRPRAPGVGGLRLREGAAPRPLPERARPADRRRCAAAPTARFEAIDWDTAIREIAARLGRGPRRARRRDDLLLRRRRAGEPPRRRLRARHPRRARLDLHLERARAGEDRRVLGRRPALRPPALPHHAATSSTPRSRSSSARTRGSRTASRARASMLREIADRSGARADRHRSAPHRDRRARRLPPPGAARHRRVLPRARCSRVLVAGGPRRPRRSSREHARGVERAARRARARSRSPTTARAPASPRRSCARSRAGIARAESVSIFEDLGIQQAPHSTLNSYLEKLLYLLTGNFAKRGRA